MPQKKQIWKKTKLGDLLGLFDGFDVGPVFVFNLHLFYNLCFLILHAISVYGLCITLPGPTNAKQKNKKNKKNKKTQPQKSKTLRR